MSSIGDRVTQPGAAFSACDGDLSVFVDRGIHLKAVTKEGEPVQLDAAGTRALIRALEDLLLLIE